MRYKPRKTRNSAYRSNKCRSTWFKHNNKVKNSNVGVSTESSSVPGVVSVQGDNSHHGGTVRRLSKSLAADVLNASNCTPGTLPFKLRPATEPVKQKEVSADPQEESNENIIINFLKLESAFQEVSKHHCKQPAITTSLADRKGLCVFIQVKCKNCDFDTGHMPLFETIKLRQGQSSGTLNNSVLLPAMVSKMGLTDIQLVLACLNVSAPNKRGMQKKLNTLSDQVQKLDKQQLIKNQEYVRDVQYLAGRSGTDIEYDVSYTSRPMAGQTTATQCFAPVLEKTTVKHLPVDVQVANKLCSLKKCPHTSKKCQKNYPDLTSINQAESTLLKKSLTSIAEEKILTINSVTTDGSPQLAKALREISSTASAKMLHYKCFVHNMRNLHKHLRAVKIRKPVHIKQGVEYTKMVATSIRSRIRAELKRLKLTSKSVDQYVKKAQICVGNILSCSTNDHSNCRKASLLCTAHLKRVKNHKHVSYLPNQKYIKLSAAEKMALQKVIDKYFGPQQLKDTAKFYTTNACESLHSRLFLYAPKNTVWSRNFPGLCHSVALGASLGRGMSLLQIAQDAGIPVHYEDPFFKYIQSIDRTAHYHARRRRTYRYKSARYLNRRKNAYRSVLSASVYGSETVASIDHAYGVNLGK